MISNGLIISAHVATGLRLAFTGANARRHVFVTAEQKPHKMPNVIQFAAWEGIILVSGLCGIVAWKLMTGGIRLNCLLHGDARAPGGKGHRTYFSAGRAQMLMATVIGAGYFLLQVIQDPSQFPDVPTPLLVALGGSSTIYLGGKAQALYLGRFRDLAALLDRRKQQ